MKPELREAIILSMFFVILIIILAVIIVLLAIFIPSIPSEPTGKNNQQINLSFQVKILDNSTNINDIRNSFESTKRIWLKYNISLNLSEIDLSPDILSEQEKEVIFELNCSDEQKRVLKKMNQSYFKKQGEVIVIIFHFPEQFKNIEGKANICGYDFILLESKTWNYFLGWNLAHEIGHILNIEHDSRLSLITSSSQLKFLRPNYLNESQIKVAIKRSEILQNT